MANTPVIPIPIRTKLHRPRQVDDLVARPRLHARLDQALDGKLTLVSAPAGFGKTTLVAAWLDDCDLTSAWLAVDEDDRDLTTFLLYVVIALQDALPTACPQTEHLLRTQPTPLVDVLLATFINELTALVAPLVLVIDDYDRVQNEAISHFMMRLVDALPPRLHLILITRSDPLLPLPRLRVRQALVEIRAGDLRFSTDEAEAFLHRAAQSDDQALAATLHARTEGWPAGLRLAALSMRDAKDPAAIVAGFQANPNRYVGQYLAAEVLVHQSEEMQNFLRQSSILDQFCAELCDAVNAYAPGKSRRLLDELVRANLFLVELDEEHGWYRYHHLFQEMLQQMLIRRIQPDAPTALHRRAGTWFIEHGFVELALRHALAAHDMAWAADMLERESHNPLNRVDRHRFVHWLSLLDDDVIWQRPRLVVAKAMQLYRQSHTSALLRLLDNVETARTRGRYHLSADEDDAFRGSVQTFRACTCYLLTDDAAAAYAAATEALRLLPLADRGGRGIALGFYALALQALGREDEARARLTQAIEDPTGLGPAKPQAFLGLAFLQLMAGDLQSMAQTTQRFRVLAADSQQANVIGAAHFTSGFLAYELNDLAAAEAHFSRVASVRNSTNLMAATSCLLGLARIHQLRGEFDAAQQVIHDVRVELMRQQSLDILPQVEAMQASQWVLTGEIMHALRWARTVGRTPAGLQIFCLLAPAHVRAQLICIHGDDTEVGALVRELQADAVRAEARHNRRALVRLLVSIAQIEARLGQETAALATLKRAVELAWPGGLIRTFVDYGPALSPLLEKLAHNGVAPRYVAQLRNAYDPRTATNGRPRLAAQSTSQLELLTRRELEVLDLLQQGLTNQEIADQLVISLHTAKRHVSNIYSKLDVDSRKELILSYRQNGQA